VFAVLATFAVEGKHKKYAPPPPPPPPLATPPPPPPAPPPPEATPPYQIHGCGYICSDSNDCDAPCTVCCANMTCCYEVPMFP